MMRIAKLMIILCMLVLLLSSNAQASLDHYQSEMLARREKEQKEWLDRQRVLQREREQEQQRMNRMMYEANRPGNPGIFGQAAGNAYRYGY